MPFRPLIDVRPPYFALEKLSTPAPGTVHAQVRREHMQGFEIAQLPAAEAGRHLAILGSCASASVRTPASRHYYLANRARIVQHFANANEGVSKFDCKAECVQSTARESSAHATLSAAGSHKPLFELDVTYKVLAQPVFQRLFAAHRKELRASPRQEAHASEAHYTAMRANPYRNPLPIEITHRDEAGVSAILPEVTPEMCAGHFAMYPCLPVAILMHSLSTLSGEALRARWSDSTHYRMHWAEVRADRLAFAGEGLRFDARYSGSGNGYEATARLLDGSLIGSMTIELEAMQELALTAS